jgi:hypothetical protein
MLAGTRRCFVLVVLAAVWSIGCSDQPERVSPCVGERADAKDAVLLTTYLESWVDERVSLEMLDDLRVEIGGLAVPGKYQLLAQSVEWDRLGLSGSREIVRLVGPRAGWATSRDAESLKSVFFGRGSRVGYVVRTQWADDFGLGSNSQYASRVSERVAFVCIPRD